MHFLFPSDPLKPRAPEEFFRDQMSALSNGNEASADRDPAIDLAFTPE